MPIIRSELSFDKHFVQIPNAWLRDSRLSLKAIGLLAQLLTHSKGWSVSIRSLAIANGCGVDLIRSAVAELEAAGYLKRDQGRAERGRFGEATWITSEPSDYPASGLPSSDYPSSVNPSTKKTIVKNTNLEEEQVKELNARKIERSILEDAFKDFWQVYPRKVGKQAARKAFEKAYEALGDANAIVEGARRYAEDPNRLEAYTAHPTTWLNAGRWDDDPLPERVKSKEELAEEAKRLAAEKNERLRILSIEANRKAREEAERRKKELEENPLETCEHGRIIYACSRCYKKKLPNNR